MRIECLWYVPMCLDVHDDFLLDSSCVLGSATYIYFFNESLFMTSNLTRMLSNWSIEVLLHYDVGCEQSLKFNCVVY